MIAELADLSNRDYEPDDYFGLLYFIRYNKLGLYPKSSLTKNMGHDGSGMHCGINDRYKKIKIYQHKINLKKEVIVKNNLDAEIQIGKHLSKKKYKKFTYFIFNVIKYQFPKLRSFLKKLINFIFKF